MFRKSRIDLENEIIGNTTYTIPSIVIEVSAILVDMTIFLPGIPFLFLGGALSNIFYCIYGGKDEYKGTTKISPTFESSNS